MREMALGGMFHRDIASEFGVSQTCVSSIVRGEHWGHVHQELIQPLKNQGKKRIGYTNAEKIRRAYSSGTYDVTQLANLYGVHPISIERVLKRITWK